MAGSARTDAGSFFNASTNKANSFLSWADSWISFRAFLDSWSSLTISSSVPSQSITLPSTLSWYFFRAFSTSFWAAFLSASVLALFSLSWAAWTALASVDPLSVSKSPAVISTLLDDSLAAGAATPVFTAEGVEGAQLFSDMLIISLFSNKVNNSYPLG